MSPGCVPCWLARHVRPSRLGHGGGRAGGGLGAVAPGNPGGPPDTGRARSDGAREQCGSSPAKHGAVAIFALNGPQVPTGQGTRPGRACAPPGRASRCSEEVTSPSGRATIAIVRFRAPRARRRRGRGRIVPWVIMLPMVCRKASRSASSVPPLTTHRAAALQHMSSGRSIQAIAQAPSSSRSRQTMLPGR